MSKKWYPAVLSKNHVFEIYTVHRERERDAQRLMANKL